MADDVAGGEGREEQHYPPSRPAVIVSGHARDQFRARFSDDADGKADSVLIALIRGEVLAAIRQGRRSKNRPRWLTLQDYPRSAAKGENVRRFAWTPDERRAYLIKRRRMAGKGETWIVLTTLCRLPTLAERTGVPVLRTVRSIIRRERKDK